MDIPDLAHHALKVYCTHGFHQIDVAQSVTVKSPQLSRTQPIPGLCVRAAGLVRSICTKTDNQNLWKGNAAAWAASSVYNTKLQNNDVKITRCPPASPPNPQLLFVCKITVGEA